MRLDIGKIPIDEDTVSTVALTLLQIFPHLLKIEFHDREWKGVVKHIGFVKGIRNDIPEYVGGVNCAVCAVEVYGVWAVFKFSRT